MPILTAKQVEPALRRGSSARIAIEAVPRFRPGDRVVTRNINPLGHTRLPRYARCRRGVIARDHGVFIFPDRHAADGVKTPQRLYSVRFSHHELWGPNPDQPDTARTDISQINASIFLDLFDEYLEPL